MHGEGVMLPATPAVQQAPQALPPQEKAQPQPAPPPQSQQQQPQLQQPQQQQVQPPLQQHVQQLPAPQTQSPPVPEPPPQHSEVGGVTPRWHSGTLGVLSGTPVVVAPAVAGAAAPLRARSMSPPRQVQSLGRTGSPVATMLPPGLRSSVVPPHLRGPARGNTPATKAAYGSVSSPRVRSPFSAVTPAASTLPAAPLPATNSPLPPPPALPLASAAAALPPGKDPYAGEGAVLSALCRSTGANPLPPGPSRGRRSGAVGAAGASTPRSASPAAPYANAFEMAAGDLPELAVELAARAFKASGSITVQAGGSVTPRSGVSVVTGPAGVSMPNAVLGPQQPAQAASAWIQAPGSRSVSPAPGHLNRSYSPGPASRFTGASALLPGPPRSGSPLRPAKPLNGFMPLGAGTRLDFDYHERSIASPMRPAYMMNPSDPLSQQLQALQQAKQVVAQQQALNQQEIASRQDQLRRETLEALRGTRTGLAEALRRWPSPRRDPNDEPIYASPDPLLGGPGLSMSMQLPVVAPMSPLTGGFMAQPGSDEVVLIDADGDLKAPPPMAAAAAAAAAFGTQLPGTAAANALAEPPAPPVASRGEHRTTHADSMPVPLQHWGQQQPEQLQQPQQQYALPAAGQQGVGTAPADPGLLDTFTAFVSTHRELGGYSPSADHTPRDPNETVVLEQAAERGESGYGPGSVPAAGSFSAQGTESTEVDGRGGAWTSMDQSAQGWGPGPSAPQEVEASWTEQRYEATERAPPRQQAPSPRTPPRGRGGSRLDTQRSTRPQREAPAPSKDAIQEQNERCREIIEWCASSLSSKSLRELRSYSRPSATLKKLFETFALLLGVPDPANTPARKLLIGNVAAKMRGVNFDDVNVGVFRRVRKLLVQPDFDEETVRSVCQAAVPLAIWCRAIGVCLARTKFFNQPGPEIQDVGALPPVDERSPSPGARETPVRRGSEQPMVYETGGQSLIEDDFSAPNPSGSSPGAGSIAMGPFVVQPDLTRLSPQQLEYVRELTVSRPDIGSITFHGTTDCRTLDIPRLVHLDIGEVLVYPEPGSKAPVGQGLNKCATVTMYQCWPPNGRGHLEDPSAQDRYRKKIQQMTEEKRAKFIDYDCGTGVWQFQVEHF